eukprot:COSAG06_NODE_34464_length_474_cov_0.752000_2_plen_25_part_01
MHTLAHNCRLDPFDKKIECDGLATP